MWSWIQVLVDPFLLADQAKSFERANPRNRLGDNEEGDEDMYRSPYHHQASNKASE